MAGLTADCAAPLSHRGTLRNENGVARVISATELSESQASAITNMLCKKLNKQVEISLNIDPSVIGGLYIHVSGIIIDRTIKKQLADLRDAAKRGDAV